MGSRMVKTNQGMAGSEEAIMMQPALEFENDGKYTKSTDVGVETKQTPGTSTYSDRYGLVVHRQPRRRHGQQKTSRQGTTRHDRTRHDAP